MTAAFIPDRRHPGISWLLIGERGGGERHAQLKGPSDATEGGLDEVLACAGWRRTLPWVVSDEGYPATVGVEVVDTALAEAYRWRL